MSDVSDLRYGVHSLSREIRAHRRPGALTETQYLVLGSLDRGGPATPAELGEAHHVRAQTLTPALNALADAGLVRRRRDETDRRRQYVELTAAGRAVIEEDREIRNAWLETAMAERLTDLERGVLLLAGPVLAKLADGGCGRKVVRMQKPPNPSTLQARVIVDELVRGGVTDVVLCPGSRNAPLAFAVHAADARGELRLHVRIDERTAGFLAVGLAAAARRPVAIIMTSGTAVANLAPAVYEANYARVPLLVVSANRPYELLGSGANQTVEQFGIFGTQVRASLSLGLAEPGLDRNSQWRSAVCRALSAARGARTGNAGPVQFDIPLREPLVPDDPSPEFAHGRPDGGPWTVAPVATLDVPLPIDLTPDTVVISGHGAGENPALAGLPTVAEPTAPHPANPLHPWALPALKPRQAIICGRPTLHREVSALLADPEVTVYAVTTGPRWPDVSGNVAATGTRVLPVGEPDDAWLQRAAAADAAAREAVTDGLDAEPVTGLHVARAVCAALRTGDQLVVGASNPVRDVALAGDVPPGVRVLSNRGVAGIDGTVSTAVGAALAHPDRRTVALMGDLTFVHDASGLLIGPEEPRPANLTIVVANDNGGGIFNLLEQGEERYSGAEYDGAAARVFGTPHGTDIGSLCAAYGVEYVRADLGDLADATRADGLRVVEVRTERTGLRALHAGMRARISAAVPGAAPGGPSGSEDRG